MRVSNRAGATFVPTNGQYLMKRVMIRDTPCQRPSRKPELYDRTSPTPDKENLFNKPEAKKVIADLTERLAAWGEKTGDKMTAQLIRQWQLG